MLLIGIIAAALIGLFILGALGEDDPTDTPMPPTESTTNPVVDEVVIPKIEDYLGQENCSVITVSCKVVDKASGAVQICYRKL